MNTVTNSLSPALPAMRDIRDIKPPYVIATGWEWVPWAVLVILLIAGALLLWWWLRRKPAGPPPPPPVPPHIRAKMKLAEALALIHDPKPFCVLVSDTVRFYLEERFEIRAPERTTEEFLRELRTTDRLLKDQKESLGEFLASCDLVKFAKYEPGEGELRGLHGSALRLVEETEPAPAENEPPAPTIAS